MSPLAPHRLTGMAAPLAIWALHFLCVYITQALACAHDALRTRIAGAELVTWLLLLATALALTAILALGLRAWRARGRQAATGDSLGRQQRFIRTLTAAAAMIASIAVVFTAIPILLLTSCTV